MKQEILSCAGQEEFPVYHFGYRLAVCSQCGEAVSVPVLTLETCVFKNFILLSLIKEKPLYLSKIIFYTTLPLISIFFKLYWKFLIVFLLGAAEGVAKKAAINLMKKYKNLKIAGVYSPSYTFETNAEEIANIIRKINRTKPDILCIGLGAPKQEKFYYKEMYHRPHIRNGNIHAEDIAAFRLHDPHPVPVLEENRNDLHIVQQVTPVKSPRFLHQPVKPLQAHITYPFGRGWQGRI